MNKNTNHRNPFAIVGRLIVLVKPMLPIMLAAIVMGVAPSGPVIVPLVVPSTMMVTPGIG